MDLSSTLQMLPSVPCSFTMKILSDSMLPFAISLLTLVLSSYLPLSDATPTHSPFNNSLTVREEYIISRSNLRLVLETYPTQWLSPEYVARSIENARRFVRSKQLDKTVGSSGFQWESAFSIETNIRPTSPILCWGDVDDILRGLSHFLLDFRRHCRVNFVVINRYSNLGVAVGYMKTFSQPDLGLSEGETGDAITESQALSL